MGATRFAALLVDGKFIKVSRLDTVRYLGRQSGEEIYEIEAPENATWARFYRSNSGRETVTIYAGKNQIEEFGSFEMADAWTIERDAPPPATLTGILELAAKLPSGLNDAHAAEKLLAERQELLDAITGHDRAGALTEAADAAYYAAKHLDWVARQLGLSVDDILALCVAKYALRARPGNPKRDEEERQAVLAIVPAAQQSVHLTASGAGGRGQISLQGFDQADDPSAKHGGR